jgi:hypothetical protein
MVPLREAIFQKEGVKIEVATGKVKVTTGT